MRDRHGKRIYCNKNKNNDNRNTNHDNNHYRAVDFNPKSRILLRVPAPPPPPPPIKKVLGIRISGTLGDIDLLNKVPFKRAES